MTRVLFLLGLGFATMMHGCRTGSSTEAAARDGGAGDAAYEQSIETWHAERVERLRADDGWLTLVGLHWLEPGDNRVGARGIGVTYAGFPYEEVGVITVHGSRVTFRTARGAVVGGVPVDGVLRADADGPPTVLEVGSARFYVIRRGPRLGVRIKDPNASLLAGFRGIERYPVDPAWRVTARWDPTGSGTSVPVDSVIGVVSDEVVAGRARFEHDGTACSMVLLPGGDPDEFFVVFGDETNGSETYGGGRFLVATRVDGDHVVLDFNRAYNPPCAFSDFSTCPLPVDDNVLPFAVRAGERGWEP